MSCKTGFLLPEDADQEGHEKGCQGHHVTNKYSGKLWRKVHLVLTDSSESRWRQGETSVGCRVRSSFKSQNKQTKRTKVSLIKPPDAGEKQAVEQLKASILGGRLFFQKESVSRETGIAGPEGHWR